MTSEPIITAFLPTIKPEESKDFYQNILGLKLISDDPYASEFEGKGSALRITRVAEFTPHPFAVLGFKVDDIINEVSKLTKNGISFELYPALDQDDSGIWTAPSRAMVAWFKDPDSNLISLTQYP